MAVNTKLKGVQSIRTTRALLDARRVKSSAGALMELAALATERQRLLAEVERWLRRQSEIQLRLEEIAEREVRLEMVVESRAERNAELNQVALGGTPPVRAVPLAEPVRGLATRELSY